MTPSAGELMRGLLAEPATRHGLDRDREILDQGERDAALAFQFLVCEAAV